MADEKKDLNETLQQLNNTADVTDTMDPEDIAANKVMAILAYLGILVLVPLFAAKGSAYAKYHTNQGLILCILAVVLNIINTILSGIPLIGFLVGLVIGIIDLVILILMLLGIINAATGKAKELPIIGKFVIIK